MITTTRYGWHPSIPDHRDAAHAYARLGAPVHNIPIMVDLRPKCSPVEDQGQLGSCTANAIVGALEFLELLAVPDQAASNLSRLFVYYNERVMEHTVSSDAGAEIRDGVKSVNNLGTCLESTWPYLIGKFKSKPPVKAFSEALNHKTVSYHAVDNTNLTEMKSCLAQGFPIIGGFTVYESFESDAVAKTGVVPMPGKNEQTVGGHAILVVGYDDKGGMFIVRNSWGPGWGQKGYFTVPYSYFTNADLATDFWTIRK